MKQPEILYRDEWLLAINKPSGLLSEPDGFQTANAADWVADALRLKFVGQIHRLDKLTSGVLMFALKKDSLKKFNKLQEEKQILKKYIALTPSVHVDFAQQGTLRAWLKKSDQSAMAEIRSRSSKKFTEVLLPYVILSQIKNTVCWELVIQGGKYHQIRAQLAHIGCPILGDEKYGSQVKAEDFSIALHARYYRFMHPYTSQEIEILAPFPNSSFWTKNLGKMSIPA